MVVVVIVIVVMRVRREKNTDAESGYFAASVTSSSHFGVTRRGLATEFPTWNFASSFAMCNKKSASRCNWADTWPPL